MATCKASLLVLGVAAMIFSGCESKQVPKRAKKPGPEKSANRDAGPDLDAVGFDAAEPARPGIAQVAVGRRHVCALTEKGAVHCWGSGQHGRLGYGNTDSIGDDEPASAGGRVALGKGKSGRATQLAAGSGHTCALMATGAVRCWGRNSVGQLGYGHTNDIGDDETPDAAGEVPIGGNAVQIAVGASQSCALMDSGDVRCWGRDTLIRKGSRIMDHVGDNEPASDNPVVPLKDKPTSIAVGQLHQCALFASQKIGCWRHPDEDDEMLRRAIPKLPNVALASVAQLAAGQSGVCAVVESGKLHCWGEGSQGYLGYPGRDFIGIDADFDAIGSVALKGAVADVAIGAEHMCGLLKSGEVYCWGSARLGSLGYGDKADIGDDETPEQAGPVDVGGPVVGIAAGGYTTCALLKSGHVRCWGYGKDGTLGHGNKVTIGDVETPASVGDVPVW